MTGIQSGVNVMNKFVSSGNTAFFGYIDYMNRKEARHEHFNEFNLFNNYMGNPEKSTGVFTKNNMQLNDSDLRTIQDIFRTAQENNSLLWQTVISFDNRWLAENGLYDYNSKVLDEKKLKSVAVGAISKMLHQEGLDNAVWTASIHYNTDNIHIHVGTVEPIPMRETKFYAQYTYKTDEKNRLKKEQPILDTSGNLLYREEYKGKFKQKSLQLCKQHITNEITSSREMNFSINRILRDVIVKDIKERNLMNDSEFLEALLKLRVKMPDCPKNLWNYNNNILIPMREEIDKLSKMFLEKYHKEDFKQLRDMLQEQQMRYRIAYGNTGRDYAENKIEDLYSRLGNTILKTVKNVDLEKEKQIVSEDTEYQFSTDIETPIPEVEISNISNGSSGAVYKKSVYYAWDEEYKLAKSLLYLDREENSPLNFEKAYELLMIEEEKGNVLATYDIAEMHLYGKGKPIDEGIAESYFQKSLKGFLELEKDAKGNPKGYLAYRVGKQYMRGYGTEINYEKAYEYFRTAVNAKRPNKFAQYALGTLYYHGWGVEKDYQEAANLFHKSALQGNGYAAYAIANIIEEKLIENQQKDSESYYKIAFESFQKMEKQSADDKLQYRLGSMLYDGKGTIQNKEEAVSYFEAAAKAKNVYAQYRLAKHYFQYGSIEQMERAETMLKELAEQGMDTAQYALGKILLDSSNNFYNQEKGIHYLTLSAENGNKFSQYTLGKALLDEKITEENKKVSEKYLILAAEQELDAAQYLLGKEYLSGEKFEINIEQGINYLENVAKRDNIYAQYLLGKEYLSGEKVSKNSIKAESYLKNVARRTENNISVIAQYVLGKEYMTGENLEKDMEKAVFYLTEASEAGNQYAQYTLGKTYRYGNGIEKNLSLSLQWLTKSALQGNVYAAAMLDKSLQGKSITLKSTISNKAMAKLDHAVTLLKRGLNNSFENYKNQKDFEELQRKIEYEKSAKER